jgi:hypothetical protein
MPLLAHEAEAVPDKVSAAAPHVMYKYPQPLISRSDKPRTESEVAGDAILAPQTLSKFGQRTPTVFPVHAQNLRKDHKGGEGGLYR